MNSDSDEFEMENNTKDSVSDHVWKLYHEKMFPAKPLNGKPLKILRAELNYDFELNPEKMKKGRKVGSSEAIMRFSKMCARADKNGAGLAWLNALHKLRESDDDDNKDENEEKYEDPACFFTPLTYVIENDPDDWRTVELLLSQGADPNLRDGMGEPPLFKVVVNNGRWRTASYLLDYGANPLAGFNGKSIALWAKEAGEIEEPARMIWETTEIDIIENIFITNLDVIQSSL